MIERVDDTFRMFCFDDVQVFLGERWLEAPFDEDLDMAPVALFFTLRFVDLVDNPILVEGLLRVILSD